MATLPAETDVLIVGGGPAGLAAALAARKAGFQVTVADRGRPPIDKACGEGMMPDGVAALREVGVDLKITDGAPFRGIRFLDRELVAEAAFPNGGVGIGIRRTRLHEIMVDATERAGATLCWQTSFEAFEDGLAKIGGKTVRCRWVLGADGLHSRVRKACGLQHASSTSRRAGLRQHFRIEPWTDFVEVYWNHDCQANVTPIGPDEVCIAMIGTLKEVRVTDLSALFPRLAGRLQHAEPLGAPRGAITMSSRLSAVTRGHIALLGDASGTVDAVTGEGMHLSFRQAQEWAEALSAGDLSRYALAHRRMQRMPQLMARLLLLLGGNDFLRRATFRALAAIPSIFTAMLAFHVGGLRPFAIPLARSGTTRGVANSLRRI